MNRNIDTRKILTEHIEKYPLMQVRDVMKLLYQGCFGCGHMVTDKDTVKKYIISEHSTKAGDMSPVTEGLDGRFCRVHLGWLDAGLSPDTLASLLMLSADKPTEDITDLEERLNIAGELIHTGILPFSAREFNREVRNWRDMGYPVLRHSDIYKQAYRPTYRVISEYYIPFLPLLARIDSMLTQGNVRLAIEGGSASGKSTLGDILSQIYDCTLLHMDDFFLQPHMRTPDRLSETGGNVDYERFCAEVTIPLMENKEISYRPYDCSRQTLSDAVILSPKPLTVTEGAYSMHPRLQDCYTLSVYLDISPELQRQRIVKRNSPDMAKRFFEEWIPMEKRYFDETDIKSRCDMVIDIK